MEPLEIVVTGNVDGAKSSLQTVQAELGKTALAASKTGDSVDDLSNKIAQLKAANSLLTRDISTQNSEYSKNIKSIAELTKQQNAAIGTSSDYYKELANKIQGLKDKNEALSGGLSENIELLDQSKGAVKFLSEEVTKAEQPHKILAAAIQRIENPSEVAAREINNFSRRLLYMAGASVMGLAVAGFQLILPYIEEFISGLDKSSTASKLAVANIANLSDINKAAAENTAKQTASLSTLYSIATDVTRSMYARTNAVKELQKEFPDYFKNISQENILNGNAKSAYDSLTNSLIATALAKAQLDKITDIGLKKADVSAQIDDLNAARKRQLDSVRGNKALAVQGGGAGGVAISPIQTPEQQKTDINLYFDDKIKKLQPQIDSFDSQIKSIRDRLNPEALLSGDGKENAKNDKPGVLAAFDAQIKVLKDYKNNIATTAQEIASVNAQIKNLEAERAKFDPKKEKKTNPFEIDLKALEDNYKEAQSLLVQQYDANTTDAKKNTTAVNDLLLKAQETFLEQKLALIKQYGKKEGDVDLEIAKNQKAIIANQLNFSISQIASLPKVQNAPKINFVKATTEKIDPKIYYQFSDAIKKALKDQSDMNDLLTKTATLLDKTVGPAFDTLFTGILDGSHNAFKAFGDAIKQMLVQLAAAVIKAAIFAGILSLISGGASTVVGAAGGGKSFSDIFSKSLKGIFGFSKGGEVKGYATGGMISGPGTNTSDSILARLSKGEYIMNAATVSKFGSSFFDNLNSGMLPKFNRGGNIGSPQIVASQSAFDHYFHGEVAGDKLLLLHDRAVARRGRNG